MDVNDVLRHAVAAGASAVHLKVGQPPVLRTDGGLERDRVTRELAVLDQVTVSVLRRRELFDASGDLDFACSAPTGIYGLPGATHRATEVQAVQGSYAG